MTEMIKSKKIRAGLYQVSANGRVFEVEDAYQARGDGRGFRNDWNLFEMIEIGNGANREYCQSFNSKRDAMVSAEYLASGGV